MKAAISKLCGTKYFIGFLLALTLFQVQAQAKQPMIVKVPAFKVIAVAAKSSLPVAFAAAYGKLAGYYTQPGRPFRVVFPQISLSLNGRDYAAIRFTGAATTEGPVRVIALPACTFLRQSYIGNYTGIPHIIADMVKQAQSNGYSINSACGIRVYELNSPDDTPAEKLSHEIYVPITRTGT